MNDLIEKLSNLRSQFNCFDENEREAYHVLSEAIKVISERPEPCEDDKHCSNCIYSGRPIYKSPCSEYHDNSQWEMKPISRSHENGAECEDTVSKEQVLKLFSTHDEKYLYEAIQILPSAAPKVSCHKCGGSGKMESRTETVPAIAKCNIVSWYTKRLQDGTFDIMYELDGHGVFGKTRDRNGREIDANAWRLQGGGNLFENEEDALKFVEGIVYES